VVEVRIALLDLRQLVLHENIVGGGGALLLGSYIITNVMGL
jgi:hypothetical protein